MRNRALDPNFHRLRKPKQLLPSPWRPGAYYNRTLSRHRRYYECSWRAAYSYLVHIIFHKRAWFTAALNGMMRQRIYESTIKCILFYRDISKTLFILKLFIRAKARDDNGTDAISGFELVSKDYRGWRKRSTHTNELNAGSMSSRANSNVNGTWRNFDLWNRTVRKPSRVKRDPSACTDLRTVCISSTRQPSEPVPRVAWNTSLIVRWDTRS